MYPDAPRRPRPPREPLDSYGLIELLEVNVNNEKLNDEAFREFIRNSLPLYLKNKS